MPHYTRPALSPEHHQQIRAALAQFERRSKTELLAALALFIGECARLWAECNEHRAARGFDPMPWDIAERG